MWSSTLSHGAQRETAPAATGSPSTVALWASGQTAFRKKNLVSRQARGLRSGGVDPADTDFHLVAGAAQWDALDCTCVHMRRKTRAFAKCRDTLSMQVQLFKSYYDLSLAHSSLNGKTPAQAAGLTDHQWGVRELLTFGASGFSKIT